MENLKTICRRVYAVLCIAILCWGVGQAKEHTVERGETIESIAARYGVTKEQILERNPVAKELFYTGMVLEIPDNAGQNSSSIADDNTDGKNYLPAAKDNKTKSGNVASSALLVNRPVDETKEPSDKKYFGFSQFLWQYSFVKGGNFKENSCYGLTSGFYAQLYNMLYAGGEFNFKMNYGLMPSDFAGSVVSIYAGPGIFVDSEKRVFIACPMGVDIRSTGKPTCVFGMSPQIMLLHNYKGGFELSVSVPLSFYKGKAAAGIALGIGFSY